MTQAKHTPGPWRVLPDTAYYGRIAADDGTNYGIEIAQYHRMIPNAQANACLIAAAPELLDALEDADEEIQAWRIWAKDKIGPGAGPEKPMVTTKVLQNISATIAKAKGN